MTLLISIFLKKKIPKINSRWHINKVMKILFLIQKFQDLRKSGHGYAVFRMTCKALGYTDNCEEEAGEVGLMNL